MRLSNMALGAAVMVLAGVTAVEASAWTRHSTTYTARGPYTSQAAGGCAYSTCGRSVVTYGPYGGAVSRSGSVTQVAPGVYAYGRTVVGPYGRSATRTGAVTVSPGS
ncbi:hypothetical protein [Microbaculum marinum]|uniref:Uncharacterized protein n=1 Tax=Microbaculum marinum TaxID=1764581 RepID=A0AAW9RZ08_9HYPH